MKQHELHVVIVFLPTSSSMQSASFLRRIILSCVACLAVSYCHV